MFKIISKKVSISDLIKNGSSLKKRNRIYLLTESDSIFSQQYYGKIEDIADFFNLHSKGNVFFIRAGIFLYSDLNRYILFYVNRMQPYRSSEITMTLRYSSDYYKLMGFLTYFTRGRSYSSQDVFDTKYRKIMDKQFLRKLNTLNIGTLFVNKFYTKSKKFLFKQQTIGPYEIPGDMSIKQLYTKILTNIIEDDVYGMLKKKFK